MDDDRLYEHAACGLLLADAQGRVLRANATLAGWLGRAPGSLDGQRTWELLVPASRVLFQTHVQPLLQHQGSVSEVRLDLAHAPGGALPVLLNGVRRGSGAQALDEFALMVVHDRVRYERELLAARQRAEQALAEQLQAQGDLEHSRQTLQLAMRAGRMGAWTRDLVTNEVWWSRELEELVGLPPGGFAGTEAGFFDLVHPEDRERVTAVVAEAVARGEDYVVDFRIRLASGEWGWMEGRGRATEDASGLGRTLYGLGIDVGERKRAEAERLQAEARLRELNEQLSQADRQKDEFLATLAHELRNPLAPVRTGLQLLKVAPPASDIAARSREIMERQVVHMVRLIDDLLDVSRVTRGRLELHRQRVSLQDVVGDAVEAGRPLLEAARHRLAVSMPERPVLLEADATRLTQVVGNLLNNAARYTAAEGHIELGARLEGHEAVITVRDDGIGIPRDMLDRVFDLFAQVPRSDGAPPGGLGIGLSLVRRLVELHGGRVTAESAGPGRGSTFTVRLPAMADDTGSAPVPEPGIAAQGGALERRRVLVVDDNVDAAQSIALLLGVLNQEVHTVHTGTDALAAVDRLRPELVFLDIGLPDLSGHEVARRLRAQHGAAGPVLVALTGWGADVDRRRSEDAGFDLHLTKPADPARIESVLRRHRCG